MNQRWNALSMGSKLRLLIQIMLVVVLVLAQIWLMQHFKQHIFDAAENRAHATADGVINGMNMLTLTDTISNPENRKLYIRKMSDTASIRDAHHPRRAGEQAVRAGAAGRAAARRHGSQSAEQRRTGVSGAGIGRRFAGAAGGVPFIAVTNFRGTNCLRCHQVAPGTINGAASIVLD